MTLRRVASGDGSIADTWRLLFFCFLGFLWLGLLVLLLLSELVSSLAGLEVLLWPEHAAATGCVFARLKSGLDLRSLRCPNGEAVLVRRSRL